MSYITFVSPEKAKLWAVGKTTIKDEDFDVNSH